MTFIVRVALDVPLNRLFDYTTPDVIGPGCLVRVPFGRAEKTGVVFDVAETSEIPFDRLRPVSRYLSQYPPLPQEWRDLINFCSRYYQHPVGAIAALALPAGLRERRSDTSVEKTLWYRLGDDSLDVPRRGSVAERVLARLAQGPAARQELCTLASTASKVLKSLLASGHVAVCPPPFDRRAEGWLALTDLQAGALQAVSSSYGQFAPYLLHGVTGSGKTEVYLRLIELALERQEQALMLVPEIALTPQLEARVAARFPGLRLVSLHSGLARGVRAAGFLAAMRGDADIVLGTRLAVFTPLPRLGLIVIDEEHDPSFKQHEGLRYSARDLAIWRANARKVPIVLGSATPSLESYAAAKMGRYTLLRLPDRATHAGLPAVRCVDVRREVLQEGLSEHLLRAISLRLERGEQSLIFLNRRGYAPVLACPACGWVSRCSACAANKVVHLADQRLRCHHCGQESPIPRACPGCGNQDIHPFGRGTQRLEETIAARFPQAKVLRADRDSARSATQWQNMLDAVHRGEVDILVGTQMLAKGHDFPRLTLVGVLNADAALFAADFRAPERLFAQLMQVAGRSGRGDLPGQVMIQTRYPEHPLYQSLAAHDFDGFADEQLLERERARFPPYAFQAMLRAEAPELEQALTFLRTAVTCLELPPEVRCYDVVPMRLHRRARLERAQLLIESSKRPALQMCLQRWVPMIGSLPAPRDLRWHVDVDPLEF